MNYCNSTTRYHNAGFTLIELLVSVAIFAVISVMSYQAIDTTITSNRVAEQRLEQLSQLNRAFSLISRDLLQSINRPVRDEVGSHNTGLYTPDGEPYVSFTHQGRIISIDPIHTTLQRTRYRLHENRLYRDHWQILDRAADSQPLSRALLDGIVQLGFEFIDSDAQTYSYWPYFNSNIADYVTYLPIGVRITLETETFGVITRTFLLGGA